MKEDCQAEYHVEGCNGLADGTDHFTPRCVAKKINLDFQGLRKRNKALFNKASVIKDENEFVPMNGHCHKAKDRSTPARKERCRRGFANLDELREWRNTHDLVFMERKPDEPVEVITAEDYFELLKQAESDLIGEWIELQARGDALRIRIDELNGKMFSVQQGLAHGFKFEFAVYENGTTVCRPLPEDET